MSGVHAHLMKVVRKSMPSDDKKYGLIGFERVRPDSNGNAEFWLGVDVRSLPYLAVAAIRAIPQPNRSKGERPAAFDAEAVEFAVGGLGELVLTLAFQEGAELSLKLTEHQARSLAEGIPIALAEAAKMANPGTKPN